MLRGAIGGLTAGTALSLAVLAALSAAFDSLAKAPPGRSVSESVSGATAGDSAPASLQGMDDSRPSLEVVRPAFPVADESSGLAAGADGSSR